MVRKGEKDVRKIGICKIVVDRIIKKIKFPCMKNKSHGKIILWSTKTRKKKVIQQAKQ